MLPWTEKYRPVNLDDVTGNKNIIEQFKNIAKKGNMPHMLLVGPPGIGKTTSISCLAKELLKNNFKQGFLELNASNERGIDIVRNKIKDFCKKKMTLPLGRHKIIFLDEVENMTQIAQQALRRIIEEYTHNTRFSMACNSSNQIIEPIQSRCSIKQFVKIKNENINKRLKQICGLEKIHFSNKGLKMIVEYVNGDMRNGLNILQAVSVTYGKIDKMNVRKIINKPKKSIIKKLLKLIFEKKYREIFNELTNIVDQYSTKDILFSFFNIIKKHEMDDKLKLMFIKEIGKAEINLVRGADGEILLMSLFAKLCFLIV